MREVVVKEMRVREVDGGWIFRLERTPVFVDDEIKKDKMGRTIWKTTRVPRKKKEYKTFYLCFDGTSSEWMTLPEMTNTFGRKKTTSAIKAYVDGVENE